VDQRNYFWGVVRSIEPEVRHLGQDLGRSTFTVLGVADQMFASMTDSTPPGSAFTSEPNPPGIASSRLLRGEGNIEGVLRAVLQALIMPSARG
jgi:hypothetical protein